jgi:hypothetical protein
MSDDLERPLNIERGMDHSEGVAAERKRIVALVRGRAKTMRDEALRTDAERGMGIRLPQGAITAASIDTLADELERGEQEAG